MTNQLEGGFASSSRTKRKWAAVKTVFKSEKIKQFRESVKRTKSTLVLANQQHLMMLVTAGFEQQQQLWQSAILSGAPNQAQQVIADTAMFSNTALPTVKRRLGGKNEAHILENEDLFRGAKYKAPSSTNPRSRRSRVLKSYREISNFLGDFLLRSETFLEQSSTYPKGDENEKQTSQIRLVIRPALWLERFGIKYGLQATVYQSPGHWKHNLNTFRAVPDDSLIFDYCKIGNIESVRQLLSKGEASTWDTNSKGRTPLHVSQMTRNCWPPY